MGWTDIRLRLRALASRRRAERELDEELSFHLEMEARKARLAGLPEADASRRARVNFGGVDQARERCRDVRSLGFLESLARDLRYGLRVLLRAPAFTAAAVLSLAVGIGAITAIFSLVDAVLLHTLPVRHPEQLVIAKWSGDGSNLMFNRSTNDAENRTNVFSWQVFNDVRNRAGALSGVFGFSPLGRVNLVVNGEARIAGALLVSGGYFSSLGVGTLLGRPLAADDDAVDGAPAAVIGSQLWQRAFGGDPSIVGKTIYINRHPCVIVGVTPREFFGVSPGGFFDVREADITLPILAQSAVEARSGGPARWFDPDLFWIQIMGRIGSQADAPAARAEMAAILAADLPPSSKAGSRAPKVALDPGSQGIRALRDSLHDPLLILFVITGLTLLMACANLAGLLLARAAARRKEISLRLSLGAGRLRVVRQLLCEGALISAGGTLAGLLVAWWGVRALLALAASGRYAMALDVRLDARVLAFTAAVSILATLLFALAPALRATRVDLAQGMKEDAPSSRAGGRFGPVRALVAVQIAAAVLLVSGAALFTRSLAMLRSLPLGFDPRNVVLFGVSPASNGYDEARGNDLYARLTERLGAIPGVAGATLSTSSLISGWTSNSTFTVDGETSRKRHGAEINFVGPDFLEVMRIPVVMGRGIERRDLGAAQRVAVISETAAREYFGPGSPVGKRLRWFGKPDWDYQVIGVAKDAKYEKLRGDFPATVYIPYTQGIFGWPGEMQFAVRASGGAGAPMSAIRAAVRDVDRMLPLVDVKTLATQIDESLSQERLFAFLVSLFGGVTLVLACVGLYGLVSYSVTSRTREIGVRVALGASRAGVLKMVLTQVCVVAAIGLAIGLPATLALKRILGSLLFGVQPADPASLAVAGAAVAAVAMVAAYIPARRAMRIDPVRALHYE